MEELMDKEIKKFFKTISNDGKINFQYLYEVKEDPFAKDFHPIKGKVKFYSEKSIEEFNEYSVKNYGIYFLPNWGGYQKEQITELRSCFVDIDLQDEIEFELLKNGHKSNTAIERKELSDKAKAIAKSFSEKDRNRYKEIFKNRIDEVKEHGIKPSAIIETKNGFHVYWFLMSGALVTDFEPLENLLIYCFNGDVHVKNPNRLMRVPDTIHRKDPFEPFEIKLIEFNQSVRYDIESLLEKFLKMKNETKSDTSLFLNEHKFAEVKVSASKQAKFKSLVATVNSYYPNGNIELIKKGFSGLDELKNRLGQNFQTDICLIERKDVTLKLLQQDLREFLGVGEGKFLCMFHHDKNPNGTVYTFQKGMNFFKCQSKECGLNYNIIQIVEKIAGLQRHKAYEYLKKLYGIEQIKTPWQIEQEEMIESNIELFESFAYDLALMESFPYLTRLIKTKDTISQVVYLYQLARKKLPEIAKLENRDGVVLFAPMLSIIEQISTSKGLSQNAKLSKASSANQRMNMFILFYLIGVVGLDELPIKMKNKALESRSHDSGNYKYSSRYYEILPLGTDRLEVAEEMAKYYYQSGGTIKRFGRELTISLYGQEEADRVFADRKEEKIPQLNQNMASSYNETFEKLILEKGWTTKQEIIKLVEIPNFEPKKEFIKSWKYLKHKVTDIDSIEVHDDDPSYIKWLHNFKMNKLEIHIPSIITKLNLKYKTLNAQLKSELQINNVSNHPIIYYDDSRRVIAEDKPIRVDACAVILQFKLDNPKMSVRSIAKCVGYSSSHVSKCLKSKVD